MPRPILLTVMTGLALAGPAAAQQPLPAEQQAEKALAAGRKAYNEGNVGVARERFKEVTAKFANTPQANAARYGLALAYVNAPDPDYAKAVEELKQPAGDGGFKERPQALTLTGAARRQLGVKEPNAAAAQKHFEQAAQAYATARDLLRERDPEAAARARCDHAEMLLRTNRVREARGECEPFLKDATLSKSKSRPLGLYYHGLACFLDKDVPNAGRSLMLLAPFGDAAFGPHAEYLAGRVFHLAGEAAEAGVHYEAVLTGYEKHRKDAAEQLKKPDQFKANPAEKARLEALTKAAPDYVAAAAFHAAALSYEANRAPEALARFQQFAKDYPASPLAADAALRAGFCQVQARQYDDAVKTLTPLLDKPPRLTDQVQHQLGKAQLGQAEAAPAGERDAKRKAAAEAIRKAADKAGSLATQDPDARARRHEMLFDLADALQAGKQFRRSRAALRDAVERAGAAGPPRRGAAAGRFGTRQRGSIRPQLNNAATNSSAPSRAAPSRRRCCCAWPRTSTAGPSPRLKDRNRAAEGQAKFTEAAGKFKDVAEKFPEFERVSLARFGQGMCRSAAGTARSRREVARRRPPPPTARETWPSPDMCWPTASCGSRRPRPKDALQENIVREKLTQAAGLLEAFAAANPQSPEAPAALLKLGHCARRLGATLADAGERTQTLNRAREVYERLAKEYPKHPLAGQAVVERARVRALAGDKGGALNDLRAFQSNAELQASPRRPASPSCNSACCCGSRTARPRRS